MSSNIPQRRATRATRLPDENAVKGRVPTTRGAAKPGATATAGSSKAAGVTLDTNAQNKRKREALGEVTNNKNKNVPKGISKDGKLSKPHVLITTKAVRPAAKAQTRKPTRAATNVVGKDVEQAQEDQQDDAAMAVDEPAVPAQTLHRASRRLSARTAATTSVATTTTGTRRLALRKGTNAAAVTRRTDVAPDAEEPVDDEAHRVFKRRRTSSEAGDEAIVETEVEVESPGIEDDLVVEIAQENLVAVPELEDEDEEVVVGWTDLDKDDFDDPSMVSEYVVDIFKYLSECEDQTLPNPNYIQHQEELRWSQRGVLMDYLIGLHQKFRLCPETLYLTVNLIDRFLSMRVVSILKFQLVGLASLFIASKFEEIVAPSAQHYLNAAAMQEEASEEDMLKAERYILKTLNWSISLYPQPMNWLRRISKADDYDLQVRTLAKFFLEIHVVERRLLGVKPSLIAAASIWLGRLVMNETEWTPNHAHYSGYSEKKILPVANIMVNYCLRPEKHENFIQKYASKKFSKASMYIHDWMTTRWNVGDKVKLDDELAFLKALAIERKSQGLP